MAVTRFISDLHFADLSPADDFAPHKPLLAEFLDRTLADGSDLVLVGDVFELWQTDLDKILFYYRDIMRKLARLAERQRLVYVVGNHDWVPFFRYKNQRFGSLEVKLRLVVREGNLLVEHGHMYDRWNRTRITPTPELPFGAGVARWVGWLERHVHPDIDDWLGRLVELFSSKRDRLQVARLPRRVKRGRREFDRAVRTTRRHSAPGYLQDGASAFFLSDMERQVRKRLDLGFSGVLLGHTHVPAHITYPDGKVYVNTGSWAYTRYPPTYAELRDGHLTLRYAETGKEALEYYAER